MILYASDKNLASDLMKLTGFRTIGKEENATRFKKDRAGKLMEGHKKHRKENRENKTGQKGSH